MSGRIVFFGWIAFVIAAYAFAIVFIVPPTLDARLACSVLFLLCGIQITSAGVIVWCWR